MKRTFIAAILIAISSSNASAQQTISGSFQTGQSGTTPGYQAYQPLVQHQSYPVQQATPYATQGQYNAVPQSVVPQAGPATYRSLSTPVAGTSVSQPSEVQSNQLRVSSSSKAPAPAPSIPPQPEDLIAAATSPAPAPAPSIPPQPEDRIAPAVEPELIALAEPVEPEVESILEPKGSEEELVVSSDVEAAVEPTQETIVPAEAVVAESHLELNPAQVDRSDDLTGELMAAVPDASPEVSDVEDLVTLSADTDVAIVDPVEAVELVYEVKPVDVIEPVDVVEPVEIAKAEVEVIGNAETEVAELSKFDSALKSEPIDTPAIVAAPVKPVQRMASVAPLKSIAKKNVAQSKIASRPKFQRSNSYGGWLLAIIPMLGAGAIGWLALRKRKQQAEVNSFANDALSRLNSKPAASPTSAKPTTRGLTEVARSTKAASASTNSQSQLDAVVKGVLEDTSSGTAAKAKRQEATTEVDDFSGYDQFACIRGIDSGTQKALHKAGYVRFSDLAKATGSELELALSKNERQFSSSDFSRWSSLAALAGQGDWAGFETLQASFAAPKSPQLRAEQPTSTYSFAGDDLTKVRGIGPATAELLNNAGVTKFKDLTEISPAQLQEILDAGGSKFEAIDPSMWCRQAQFQLTGTWTRPSEEVAVTEEETVQSNVTITTPEYRITEPTLENPIEENEPSPEANTAGGIADLVGVSGVLSKEEVERLEQLAGTSGQLNEESDLLEQINTIREIASSAGKSNVADDAFSAADKSKASAE